jgi:hypothetical protein
MSTATVSNIPLWGRAWSVSVSNQSGATTVFSSSAWEPETLRCTFEIVTHCFHPVWTARISIWNLNKVTALATASVGTSTGVPLGAMGDQITVSAGYQAGLASGQTLPIIFTGRIYQSMVEREGVVDLVTTWLCSTGTSELYRNYTFVSYIGGTSNAKVVQMMIDGSQRPDIPLQISAQDKATLSAVTTPRGGAISGSLADGLGQIARQMANITQTPWSIWFDGFRHNIGSLKNQKSTPDLIYSPIPAPNQNVTLDPRISYSLVGSAQQTQNGVEFRVLLDPRLSAQTPQLLVKLDGTIIRQLEVLMNSQGGTNTPPYALNQDGQYLVIGVRHIGDTRSNEWWTVVTGASTTLTAIAQVGPWS